ncbi:MAG: transcription antitermination factor NusB [Deltaproteobacteria bacterium]|nr:transcription antitermination factor NusB [Deltaproteobacteria bacterium]
MGSRRAGRAAALKILYQLDTVDDFSRAEAGVRDFFEHLDPEAEQDVRDFAGELCLGVRDRLRELDRAIEAASQNWRLARMSRIDRNILRIAAYEIMACPEVPAEVAIDEAIELGKAFGSTESAGFVNGVLDRLRRDHRAQGGQSK